MPRTRKQIKPHELRSVVLHGVEYVVHWERMTLGSSFFLPTTATVAQVKSAIRAAVKTYGYQVELRTRREYDRFGVRVWRVR
jgi:hypothetical protein